MTPARARRATPPAQPAGEPLAEYDRKRDFERTPEPPGIPRSEAQGALTFVVQKHAATRLHYDVRLEWDGVMPSWAVPKGPSSRIGEKRLAVHVEDHPLDYASFEGYIPKGAYGGGEVIVWDAGTYSPDDKGVLSFHDRAEAERRMREDHAAGKISVRFRGRKLKGSYALVRTNRVEGGRQQWLMLKHRDDAVDNRDLTAQDRSVRTGLTLEDLQRGIAPDRTLRVTPVQPLELPGVRPAPFPNTIEPMQAESRHGSFADDRWTFEPKMDGVRAIAFLRDGAVTLRSRRGLDATTRYPGVANAVARQPAHTLVLDGEVVALDERGVPSFERLQERMNLGNAAEIARAEKRTPVIYYVFDLLYLDGLDLRGVPLEDRLETLARIVQPLPQLQPIAPFEVDGITAFAAAQRYGLEGVIAKRRDSVYESGRRSRAWLKVKDRTSDEFVVGGYAAGEGGRARTFGSLIVGSYDDEGRLIYSTHVGSGFDDRTLVALKQRLDALTTEERPFAQPVPKNGHNARTWVRPEVVVEVAFTQRTRDGHLRAPVFMRVRDDKSPDEVHIGPPVVAADPEPQGEVKTRATPTVPTPPVDEVASVVEQLKGSRKAFTLRVGEHQIRLGNLDKELWPATPESAAYTKRELLEYLARVSPWMLPHLRDRPLTLTRYPNGIDSPMFYQKHLDDAPDFVEKVRVWSDSNVGDQTYLLCNNLATLLWLGQMADLALHTSLARVNPEPDAHGKPTLFTGGRETIEASVLNFPDFILFDLDPYTYAGTEGKGEEPELNRAAWEQVRSVARWLKQLLDQASLASYIKTSGATGLHVYVPVVREYDYATIRSVCGTFADFLVREHSRDVTTNWAVPKRAGKVFMDQNQNARFKSLAAPYSPRAKPGAPVSMPLRWDELGDAYPSDFTMRTALDRLARTGDVWADILDAKHDLHALLGGTAAPAPAGRSKKR
jgi:bifunctional non-homologous end joining protein LigD